MATVLLPSECVVMVTCIVIITHSGVDVLELSKLVSSLTADVKLEIESLSANHSIVIGKHCAARCVNTYARHTCIIHARFC